MMCSTLCELHKIGIVAQVSGSTARKRCTSALRSAAFFHHALPRLPDQSCLLSAGASMTSKRFAVVRRQKHVEKHKSSCNHATAFRGSSGAFWFAFFTKSLGSFVREKPTCLWDLTDSAHFGGECDHPSWANLNDPSGLLL